MVALVVSLAGGAPGAWAQDTAVVSQARGGAEEELSVAEQVAESLMAEWQDIDYDAWESFAARVEAALESGQVSDSVLGDLRNDLVKWRATFAEAKGESSVRIEALRAQLTALGDAPQDGAEETESAATRRAELEAELDKVLAPVTRATVAHAHAESLIVALDQSLRSRQVNDVSERGPTPFDYSTWLPAVESFNRTFRLAWSAAQGSWANTTQRKTLISHLPFTVPLGLFGLVLLVFGWRTVRRVGERVREGKSSSVRGAMGFVISSLQAWVPSFGALLLGAAVANAFVLDSRGEQLVSAFVGIVAVQFVARWLGNRVFGIPGASWRVLDLPANRVRFGYAMAASLGVLVGLQILLNELGRIDAYSDATLAVLNFPLITVASVVLWRLGRLMRLYRGDGSAEDEDEDRPTNFYNRTVRALGTLLTAVAIAAPIAAAFGYRNLAIFVLFPSIYSLAMIAVLMILHHFIIDIFSLLARRPREEAAQSLVPVLISVGVAIAAMPLLPLIWGYRVSDLTEFWDTIWTGVSVGETVITPTTVLTVAIVFAIGYAATRLIQGMLGSTILPKTGIEPGGQVAITSGVGYVGISIAALAAITTAGINLSSLAIVAGALSVGIGFGLQTIVSNFVSGIILLIERPIGKGDWIEVGTTMGTVKDISVRSTRIETFDRTDVIVPNSDLISGVVTNYTRGNLLGRVIVPVGVAYGTDTRRVEKILYEIAQAHPLVTINPAPMVVFQGFGADSLDFEVRVILRDVNFKLSVLTELNHQIARRFAEEGIEIPFAQRDIWLRNPEALNWAPSPVTGGPPEAPAEPENTKMPDRRPGAPDMPDAADMQAPQDYGPEDRDDD